MAGSDLIAMAHGQDPDGVKPNGPEDLGGWRSEPVSSDGFTEDDVGVWRCDGCHRTLAEVEERGHASEGDGCRVADQLARRSPRGKRRRVVAEWPGLLDALNTHTDLRHNLIRAVLEAFRADYAAKRKRSGPGLDAATRQGKRLAELGELLDQVDDLLKRGAELVSLVWLEGATVEMAERNAVGTQRRTRGKRR